MSENTTVSIGDAFRMLPAGFIRQWLGERGTYGLLLSNGIWLGISEIEELHKAADGSLWIDVRMLENAGLVNEVWGQKVVIAPTRSIISINVAHVVCALKLADK